jgi:hypothetical protein
MQQEEQPWWLTPEAQIAEAQAQAVLQNTDPNVNPQWFEIQPTVVNE